MWVNVSTKVVIVLCRFLLTEDLPLTEYNIQFGSNYVLSFVEVINPINSSKTHFSYKNKICIIEPQKIFTHPLQSSTRLLELLFVGWKEILSQNLTSFSPQLPHPPKSCPPTTGQKLRRQGLLGLHLFNSQFAYLLAHRKLLVVY